MDKLIPSLEKRKGIILDFEGIEGVTQSFMHALISDLIRKYGGDVLEKIRFKSCNDTVKSIVTIVANYMQESE